MVLVANIPLPAEMVYFNAKPYGQTKRILVTEAQTLMANPATLTFTPVPHLQAPAPAKCDHRLKHRATEQKTANYAKKIMATAPGLPLPDCTKYH
ncbi:hypothetical protein ACFOSS_16595 [Pseudaeromonas sharmana]|uniref:Uncharacterized protein n=1 Tax=Pseudaeromonas sharmana TaxID=328412 RepID=A0ABV8CSE0_9GAMM